jgi:hypothetical protein
VFAGHSSTLSLSSSIQFDFHPHPIHSAQNNVNPRTLELVYRELDAMPRKGTIHAFPGFQTRHTRMMPRPSCQPRHQYPLFRAAKPTLESSYRLTTLITMLLRMWDELLIQPLTTANNAERSRPHGTRCDMLSTLRVSTFKQQRT